MNEDDKEMTLFEISPALSDHMTKFTFDTPSPVESQHFSNRISNVLINTRCTDSYKFKFGVCLGILAIVMQVPPLFMINWIQIREPKVVNQTDDQGELLEAPFLFDMGYFKVCRQPSKNMTEFKPVDPVKVFRDFPRICVTVLTDEDLSDFSFASAIIMFKLFVPAILQIIGVLFCIGAIICSFVGQYRRDKYTLFAAIAYIISGLFIFVAVLQFICAVDDEMNSRMKPAMTGEPSKFNFHYGTSFLSTSLSFLPLQICVYLQTRIYFDRYPLPLETTKIVPGMGELVTEIISRSRKGLSTSASFSTHYRRDSRCSREVAFGGVQQEVQRLAPPLTESLTVKPAIHFCI